MIELSKCKRVGLPMIHSQALVAEWKLGRPWIVWLSYDKTMTAGTYLELWPNGDVFKKTEEPIGIVSTVKVA